MRSTLEWHFIEEDSEKGSFRRNSQLKVPGEFCHLWCHPRLLLWLMSSNRVLDDLLTFYVSFTTLSRPVPLDRNGLRFASFPRDGSTTTEEVFQLLPGTTLPRTVVPCEGRRTKGSVVPLRPKPLWRLRPLPLGPIPTDLSGPTRDGYRVTYQPSLDDDEEEDNLGLSPVDYPRHRRGDRSGRNTDSSYTRTGIQLITRH